METTRWVDLVARTNVPYIYCHQGNCEHTVMIRSIRCGLARAHAHAWLGSNARARGLVGRDACEWMGPACCTRRTSRTVPSTRGSSSRLAFGGPSAAFAISCRPSTAAAGAAAWRGSTGLTSRGGGAAAANTVQVRDVRRPAVHGEPDLLLRAMLQRLALRRGRPDPVRRLYSVRLRADLEAHAPQQLLPQWYML